jgi:signal transduction histidine kinase/ActR/RegA family two-component response regulator
MDRSQRFARHGRLRLHLASLQPVKSLKEHQISQTESVATGADVASHTTVPGEMNRKFNEEKRGLEESRRRVEEQLHQLGVSSKYKSELIVNTSYQLRTQLSTLLILAEELEGNPHHNMTDTQVQYAAVIHAAGAEILNLLSTVLSAAETEDDATTADLANLDLRSLSSDLLREFERTALDKGLSYSIDIDPDSPLSIITDPKCVLSILRNLLSNAFQFTNDGEVHVQIGLADNGWNRNTEALTTTRAVLAISVIDTGIGMTQAQRRRIVEPFAKHDSTGQDAPEDRGLSISREQVGVLGGAITVLTTLGRGSAITVYLPAGHREFSVGTTNRGALERDPKRCDDPANTDQDRKPARVQHGRDLYQDSTFSGVKILVVDDDFRNLFAMTALLERTHAEVITAESGADAIAVLEQRADIDIILMDIMMPMMDGYEAMHAIHSLDHYADVPIIAVTGKVVLDERQRCSDAGAVGYVPKPADSSRILAAIIPWLPTAATLTP